MKFNKILMGALVVSAMAACTTEKDIFTNQVFLSTPEFKDEVRVAVDENVETMSRSVAIAIAKPHDAEVSASFAAAPELLDTYRAAYYDERAELLPEGNYNIGDAQAVIKPGDVSSKEVTFEFTNLTNLDYDKTYVLPVSMSCEELPVLESARTMYYVVKEASLVNVVADMYTNRAWPEWGGFEEVASLEQFTMELLFNSHSFDHKSSIQTLMGVEDHFLLRIGDVLLPQNQIQIAAAYNNGKTTFRKHITDESLQLKKDTWYHLAVTFDQGFVKVYLNGKLKVDSDELHSLGVEEDEEGNKHEIIFENVKFKVPHSDESDGKPRCFWIGYSYDQERSLDGMISEARVWNRVLTAEEIQAENHFYKVYNPADDASLLAYWKFNEGTGKIVKDHSRYQNDLTADHNFIWYPVSLPNKQ